MTHAANQTPKEIIRKQLQNNGVGNGPDYIADDILKALEASGLSIEPKTADKRSDQ